MVLAKIAHFKIGVNNRVVLVLFTTRKFFCIHKFVDYLVL